MKRFIALSAVITLIVFNLLSLTISAPLTRAGDGNSNVAKWTLLIYLDADNNLEGPGVEDVNEMETVGSTDDVNILIQFDRIEEYDVTNGDWKDTKRFRVMKDDDKETISSPVLEEMGEVDMGDPENLIDFVKWGVDNYPAENYAIVFWNHGGAFRGVCWDDTSNDGKGDPLSMPEIRYAMLEIKDYIGKNVELVGFDACLMANIAVLYQLRDVSDYAIASGYNEPGDGWPYEKFLPALVDDPDMDAEELGRHIADTYVDSYTDQESDPDDSTAITMTLFEMAKIHTAVERLNEFALVLSTTAKNHNAQIWTARDITESYDMLNAGPFDFTGYSMYDVIDFVENMRTLTPLDARVRASASEVREAMHEFITYARVDSFHTASNGLTLYFPNVESEPFNIPGRNEYDELFDDVDFAKEKYWDEFLFHYFNKENAKDTPPTGLISKPYNNETILASDGTISISGTAFDAQDQPEIQISLDSGDWLDVEKGTVTSGGAIHWSTDWAVEDLAGEHFITLKVTDSSGNTQVITHQVNIENPGEKKAAEKKSILPTILLGIITLIILAILLTVFQRVRKMKGK